MTWALETGKLTCEAFALPPPSGAVVTSAVLAIHNHSNRVSFTVSIISSNNSNFGSANGIAKIIIISLAFSEKNKCIVIASLSAHLSLSSNPDIDMTKLYDDHNLVVRSSGGDRAEVHLMIERKLDRWFKVEKKSCIPFLSRNFSDRDDRVDRIGSENPP
ncbi:hypothetical protein DPMN_084500 [Dreissena polymorpha]|uniref:Uncharacterized protein n=1 Tax=Dreissena polymorpha TaxID=45954 RepID=A0A9D4BIK9_DREPO|nr:hypothetical protein DPMN_084500 [Dreissena polymorpha]